MATIKRKDQAKLTDPEWKDFIFAINKLRASKSKKFNYDAFVQVHIKAMAPQGHMWGAHGGDNFLPWHREFLSKMEKKLRSASKKAVSIPYWNWLKDRDIPEELSNPSDLVAWNVKRYPKAAELPPTDLEDSLKNIHDYGTFTSTLERYHGHVHMFVGGENSSGVGGTMSGSGSPNDPVFWLHHANIDRLWSKWQEKNQGKTPSTINKKLQPPPIFTRKVSQVINIADLDYEYV